MATVSVLAALAALGVAVATLVWCQRLAEGVARLRTNAPDEDVRNQLAELAGELPSLHARVDHLRQCWQGDISRRDSSVRQWESTLAELQQGYHGLAAVPKDLDSLRDWCREVEALLQQWENRLTALEQGYRGLGALARDLDSLRDFRSHVERVHAGIQKAFNGGLSGISLAPLRDEKTPSAEA